MCSTDEIEAEKKYKDPFKYVPTHTMVLYTNHLPKVGASDDGTWRRLIVIPFGAKIQGKTDIKNYTDYLVGRRPSTPDSSCTRPSVSRMPSMPTVRAMTGWAISLRNAVMLARR